ncbi:MAG: macro domain protein, partial [Clostridia bacterium]
MTQNERLDFLINHLISEDNRYSNIVLPKDSEEKFNFFSSLVNVREPTQISNDVIKLEDDYLQE